MFRLNFSSGNDAGVLRRLLAPRGRPPEAKTAFSIGDYVALLKLLKSRRVRFETLERPDPAIARAHSIHYLKHDIHHDLANTMMVAEAEFEIGVRSTFFMMHEHPLNRKFFHDPETWKGLLKIREMGHLLALHVDGFTLIEQHGDLAAGIEQTRKTFRANGIDPLLVGNTHGNSKYQAQFNFEPMNFYKEVCRPTECAEPRWMEHYGKYSLRELGFTVWADTSIWTPDRGEWLLDYFVSDNRRSLAAGEIDRSEWVVDAEKWELGKRHRRRLADYVAQGSCIYLVHPQFMRPQ